MGYSRYWGYARYWGTRGTRVTRGTGGTRGAGVTRGTGGSRGTERTRGTGGTGERPNVLEVQGVQEVLCSSLLPAGSASAQARSPPAVCFSEKTDANGRKKVQIQFDPSSSTICLEPPVHIDTRMYHSIVVSGHICGLTALLPHGGQPSRNSTQ